MEHEHNRHGGIILASASPRRRDLLEAAGLRFDIIPSRINEETFTADASDPGAYARMLAEAKADDVATSYPDTWVIGADSIVVIGDRILEKPVSEEDARRMLNLLSGNCHRVFTGYAVCRRKTGFRHADAAVTEVVFKTLTHAEIEWYIHTPEPYDKAGAYAIQGLGSFMVRSINGSYSNVVGLPVCEVMDCLTRQGALIRRAGMDPELRAVESNDDFSAN
jgi:septum formation protein